MMIREPAVAGMFYPRDAAQCLSDLTSCLDRAVSPSDPVREADQIVGAVVPHAGWICSGGVAAGVIREISTRKHPDVLIVFGAVHVPNVVRAAVFPSGAWATPLGLAQIESRLVDRLCGQCGLLESDPHAHDREHSIEVELPFFQHLLPGVPIIPVMVPVDEKASDLGSAMGRTCRNFGVGACFLCSTDLTHYGPSYGFTPHGVGPAGLRWAKDVNDRRMIDLMLAMRDREAVREAVMNRSACGGGAIAATLAACRAYGAQRADLVDHTTSEEVLTALGHEPMDDAVGYAGIIISTRRP